MERWNGGPGAHIFAHGTYILPSSSSPHLTRNLHSPSVSFQFPVISVRVRTQVPDEEADKECLYAITAAKDGKLYVFLLEEKTHFQFACPPMKA